MKILVTGYKGFIGKNLVPARKNHKVSLFEWGEPLPIIKGLDCVIHLGAISSTTETDVDKVMTQNYDFSRWILDQCLEYHVDLQYSSSASVYGLTSDFSENSQLSPQSPYAWSKYLFDRHAINVIKENSTKSHFPTIQGFRYFNIYGPHEEHKGDQASPYHKFTQQAKTTGVIKLFDNSAQYRRDFVPVSTVVETHKKFLLIRENGIWNVGTGIAKSFLDVATEIAEEHSAKIEYIPMPEHIKNQYQTYTQADINKLSNTINDSIHTVIKLPEVIG